MIIKYPRKTKFAWVIKIQKHSFITIMLFLIGIYIGINVIFTFLYYGLTRLTCGNNIIDYIYFTFVTSLTIGFGDIVPLTYTGKIIVIGHACIMALYFALMVSVLSTKLFYPEETMVFSKRIIYNPNNKMLIFRVINTNREPLISPEVRVNITCHTVGNVIARTISIPIEYDIAYLGKHDFSFFFKSEVGAFDVFDDALKAIKHNTNIGKKESRFRINIVLTGNYSLYQISGHKKYYADEIEIGESFKPIEYNDEDQRHGEIRYKKFKNFWSDFEHILRD